MLADLYPRRVTGRGAGGGGLGEGVDGGGTPPKSFSDMLQYSFRGDFAFSGKLLIFLTR